MSYINYLLVGLSVMLGCFVVMSSIYFNFTIMIFLLLTSKSKPGL